MNSPELSRLLTSFCPSDVEKNNWRTFQVPIFFFFFFSFSFSLQFPISLVGLLTIFFFFFPFFDFFLVLPPPFLLSLPLLSSPRQLKGLKIEAQGRYDFSLFSTVVQTASRLLKVPKPIFFFSFLTQIVSFLTPPPPLFLPRRAPQSLLKQLGFFGSLILVKILSSNHYF